MTHYAIGFAREGARRDCLGWGDAMAGEGGVGSQMLFPNHVATRKDVAWLEGSLQNCVEFLFCECRDDRWAWLQALNSSKATWDGLSPVQASALSLFVGTDTK